MPMPANRRHIFVDSAEGKHPLSFVPMIDINRENGMLEHNILAAITQVARSGRFIMGPECDRLEQRLADLCQVRHAVGCASGSDALLLALSVLELEAGDEVIVPSFTFFATASAVWRLGCVPVFADIDPHTFNMDPASARRVITKKTKAIVPVHLFGLPAQMDEFRDIAKDFGLVLIEDAAQALGSQFAGQAVGNLGDIGCFSFYPTKNLGGFGDGGMLTTSNDTYADRLRLFRLHGMRPKYFHEEVGYNSRLDTIQAAVLNVKLPNLPNWTVARCQHASRYSELFAEAGITDQITLPSSVSGCLHVWNQYTIRVRHGQRDALRKHLNETGVGNDVYYPVPLHEQKCFASLPFRSPLAETERAAKEVLSLPIFPTMTLPEQQTVVWRIAEFFGLAKVTPTAHLSAGVAASAPVTGNMSSVR